MAPMVSLLQVQENGSLLHDEVLGIQAKCLEGLCRSGSSLSRMDCLDRANGGVLDQTSSSRRNVPSVRTPRLCLILEFFDSGDGERLSRLCENFHLPGSPDRKQSISQVHLHVLPGASHCHLSRQHCSPRQGARRPQARDCLRPHRIQRKAARECLHQDRGEAV
ncbi:uncharacterized protein LOC9653747 isoform X2 [Selaginella moellendorffii]|uniref:uncharacterized protein LOC9653747 isoform X2 n=1 Tax=Selaginella moellendorffii TaxID=88036 RepID=UPI000D1C7CF7|nr:uncharacterized protein LOC9653747 isoform X2 [Selaginella moellendorffii]|eukprot:XP_024539211.1 uncharacterized protein LOC9653747 isoform X2 [Selaginella moellendorffii]